MVRYHLRCMIGPPPSLNRNVTMFSHTLSLAGAQALGVITR